MLSAYLFLLEHGPRLAVLAGSVCQSSGLSFGAPRALTRTCSTCMAPLSSLAECAVSGLLLVDWSGTFCICPLAPNFGSLLTAACTVAYTST